MQIKLFLLMLFTSSTLAFDILTGKLKSTLCSIAARLKPIKELHIISFNAETELTLKNVIESIDAYELVQLRLNVDKRKLAKIWGLSLAERTNSSYVHTLGHSVLLYRASNPPKNVTKLLMESSSC